MARFEAIKSVIDFPNINGIKSELKIHAYDIRNTKLIEFQKKKCSKPRYRISLLSGERLWTSVKCSETMLYIVAFKDRRLTYCH